MNRLFWLALLILIPSLSFAQSCDYGIEGKWGSDPVQTKPVTYTKVFTVKSECKTVVDIQCRYTETCYDGFWDSLFGDGHPCKEICTRKETTVRSLKANFDFITFAANSYKISNMKGAKVSSKWRFFAEKVFIADPGGGEGKRYDMEFIVYKSGNKLIIEHQKYKVGTTVKVGALSKYTMQAI